MLDDDSDDDDDFGDTYYEGEKRGIKLWAYRFGRVEIEIDTRESEGSGGISTIVPDDVPVLIELLQEAQAAVQKGDVKRFCKNLYCDWTMFADKNAALVCPKCGSGVF
jgi:hypothetical protein